MELRDFRSLVDRLVADVPPQYLDGIVAVEVSPKTVPHPVYPTVYTLGECIPVETAGEPTPSRVVLYHGSFQALAQERTGFDWRGETWETLTHELRHHLEWRARAGDLDAYDWAAEQNFHRAEGAAFDPLFYLSGERLAPDVYCVDDDLFWDRAIRRAPPARLIIEWQGRRYEIEVPERPLPLYLQVLGLEPEPVGDAVVAVRRKPRVLDLFRSRRAATVERVHARRVG